MAKTQVKSVQNEPIYIVMPLLALALASNLFLYAVSYSQSSFQRQADIFPDVVAQSSLVLALDQQVDAAQADIAASFSTVGAVMKPAMLAFFGLENYKFGVPIKTSLAARPMPAQSVGDSQQGQVLGIMVINPDFSIQYASMSGAGQK